MLIKNSINLMWYSYQRHEILVKMALVGSPTSDEKVDVKEKEVLF